MVLNQSLAVKVGVGFAAAVGFTACCVYFERKRRSQPDYYASPHAELSNKSDVARIMNQQNEEEATEKMAENGEIVSDDDSKRQQFFQQLFMAHALVEAGEVEEAVELLVMIAGVYFDSIPVFEVFEEILPPEIFGAFLLQVPNTGEIMDKMLEQAATAVAVDEEDEEEEDKDESEEDDEDEDELDEGMLAVLMNDPQFMKSVMDSVNGGGNGIIEEEQEGERIEGDGSESAGMAAKTLITGPQFSDSSSKTPIESLMENMEI